MQFHFITVALCLAALLLAPGCEVSVERIADDPVPEGPGLFAPQPLPGLTQARQSVPPIAGPSETPPPVAVPTDLPPLHAQLVGTRWRFGETTLSFRSAHTCFVRGGRVATLAPEGVDARYAFSEGSVTLEVMGESMAGTWDGENLILAGAAGQKLN